MLKYTLTHIIWESDGLDEVSLLSVGWPITKLKTFYKMNDLMEVEETEETRHARHTRHTSQGSK